ncbi:hypothetical protein [Savagea faecisuis]|uniref:Ribosomal protein L29 n=1 Tax=Savagea faecisuis TaxID=1274803 RepID=A0ABW3H010_9BACL
MTNYKNQEEIELNKAKLNVMRQRIYILERDNVKTKEYNHAEMRRQIIKIVNEVYESNL